MKDEYLTILPTTPLFAGIKAEALKIMLDCLRPTVGNFPKNSYIITEGKKYAGMGILLAGEAAIFKENSTGGRIIMEMLTAGGMFGEMIAFSTRQFWPASVMAQTESTVMFLPPEKITGQCRNLCACHKELIKNILRIISDKAVTLNRKVEYLAMRGVRQKVCAYLWEQYLISGKDTFMTQLNRSEMAEFLNISRTALSREMGRMRDDGLIDFYRASVKIKNPVDLRRQAE